MTKGKMYPRETEKNVKSVINRNYTKIIYKLDPKPVIRELQVYGVLTVAGHDVYYKELQNKIERGENDDDVNVRLLEILFTRENWWIPFIKALRECGADEIAKIIEAVLPWKEKQKLKRRRQQNREPTRYTIKFYNKGHCDANLDIGGYLPSPGNAVIIKIYLDLQDEHPSAAQLNYIVKIDCSTQRNQDSPQAVSSEDGDAVVTLTLETAVLQVPVGVLNILHKLDDSKNDWQMLAGHLSDKITMDNVHGIDNMETASKTDEVIKKFARVEGKMATFGRMITALQKMQRRDLLDEIEGFTQSKFSNEEEEDDTPQVELEFKDPEVTPGDYWNTPQAGPVAIEHEHHEDNYDDGVEEDEGEGADDLEEDKEEETTCIKHRHSESGDTKDETLVKKASDAHVDYVSTEGKKRQDDCMNQTLVKGPQRNQSFPEKEKWSRENATVPQPVQHTRSHIPRFDTHCEEQDVPLGGLNGRDQTLQETVSSSARPPQTRNTLQCQNPHATLCSQTNTLGYYYAQATPPDLNQTSNGSFYLDSSVVQEPSTADYRNVRYPAHIMPVSLPSVPPSCHERQAQTALKQSMHPNANTEYELVTPRPCKEDDDISIDEGEAVSTGHDGPRAASTGVPPESSQSPVGHGGRAETVEMRATSKVKNGLKTMFRMLEWVSVASDANMLQKWHST